MSCVWAWDWGVNFPTQSYSDDALWGVTVPTGVVTNSVVNLVSPVSPDTPGEAAVCLIQRFDSAITTPPFPGSPHDQGWYWMRWRLLLPMVTTIDIMALRSGVSTDIVRLRPGAAGNPVTMQVLVNGTLVGTSLVAIGDAASYVIAIPIDLTLTPPQAGLYIDGIEQFPLTAGSGTPKTIDRAILKNPCFTSNTTSSTSWGLQLFFDALADPGDNADWWAGDPNTVSVLDPDNSWVIFGGAATKTDAVSDKNLTTGIETSTDPDTVTFSYQATTAVLATWAPTNIIHVAAVVIGSGEVINVAALTLDDGTGVVGTETRGVTATAQLITYHAPLASGGVPWTTALVDAASGVYDVST
jgi:hypothetical protein